MKAWFEGNYRLQDIQLSLFDSRNAVKALRKMVRDDRQGDETWLIAPFHPVGPRTTQISLAAR